MMTMLPATIIQAAADTLTKGGLVAFPTETVYGLGANALNADAVARIFALKGRPSFNPLIVHVKSAEAARDYAKWNALAETLAAAFWPGPLTLVVPRAKACALADAVSAGRDTVAIRVPAHMIARQLLDTAGVPIAAPSANRSGKVSPTAAAHVREEFGVEAPLILEGGNCVIGLESTVIDVTGEAPVLLRPGSVTQEDIMARTGLRVALNEDGEIRAPGMLASHYAPAIAVRLNAADVGKDEALLAFGDMPLQGAAATMNLSVSGSLDEAATNLFAMLRALDDERYRSIAVMPVPEHGLGIAINDRLRRAAAR